MEVTEETAAKTEKQGFSLKKLFQGFSLKSLYKDLGPVRIILLSVFSLGIIIGAYNSIRIIHRNSSARRAYSELSVGSVNTASKGIQEDIEEYILPEAAEETQPVQRNRLCSMNFTELREINPEICAWLTGPGTGIDYPVMRPDNNDFYLNHLYNGKYNEIGALFVNYLNIDPFHDGNTVIFGHNIMNGTMFHVLNDYQSQDFYEACPTMMLYTPEGDFLIEFICGTIEDAGKSFLKLNFQDDEELFEYVGALRQRSTFVSPVELQPGDRLVSLCTCSETRANSRYLLVGRLVELYEPVARFDEVLDYSTD